MRRVERVLYWAPAVLWATLLLIMSGKPGEGATSALLLKWALAHSVGSLDPDTFRLMHHLFRKTVHVTAYATAGALNFRAVRGARRGWVLQWSAIAFTMAVLVAVTDEWHQTTVPGRTGTINDVGLDAIGASAAQLLWWLGAARAKRRPTELNVP